MIFIWKPDRLGGRVDMERCRASVHDGGRGCGFHQCGRKKVVEVDGIGYCKQHSPQGQAKRDRERDERHREEMDSFQRRESRNKARWTVFALVQEMRDNGWVLTDGLREKLESELRKGEQ